ncbi:MAG TPA: N-acetylmuramoyl-L-alanine amidase, partial [Phenylobacterium sp.]
MLARVRGLLQRRAVRFSGLAVVVVAALTAVAAAQASGSTAGVLKVRIGGGPAETRIVIDLDRAATGKVTGESASDQRLVVALPGVAVAKTLQGGGFGLVRGWQLDENGGTARLRIDLTAQASIKRRFLLPPADGISHYRYVIDLAAAGPIRAAPTQVVRATP